MGDLLLVLNSQYMGYHVPVQRLTTTCLFRLSIGPRGSTEYYQKSREANPGIAFLHTKVPDKDRNSNSS